VKYVNVLKDADGMKAMLKASKGDRTVPIIVEEGGTVKVGYGGG
jgi:hypothetical protein